MTNMADGYVSDLTPVTIYIKYLKGGRIFNRGTAECQNQQSQADGYRWCGQ